MTKAISKPASRTYFNNPLIEETLQHLPAALEYPDANAFKIYLAEHLHFNSQTTRQRMARYIANRFSSNGVMNLDLARAVRKFGDSQIGREILYFEYIQSIPLLQEIAVRWLAELPEQGTQRASLVSFLEMRLAGRSVKKVSQVVSLTFKKFGKMQSPKPGYYKPVWSEPPQEVFLYMLARLFPERTMVRVELFMNENAIRAMLWPAASIPELLRHAETAGHISKISQLDQYHQFTLSAPGPVRMKMLLEELPKEAQPVKKPSSADKARKKITPVDEQLALFEAVPKKKGKSKRGKTHNVG